jgi:signal transduction histidine kinase
VTSIAAPRDETAARAGEPGAWLTARGLVRMVVRAPFTRRTWLATMQVLTGLPVAVITFSVLVFLAAVGVLVLPTVVLVAVPFVALLACTDVFTAWQRSRLAAFAGLRIAVAPGVLPRIGGNGADGDGVTGTGSTLLTGLLGAARRLSTWRQIAYHLLAGPVIALLGAAAVTATWSTALIYSTISVQRLIMVKPLWDNPGKLVAQTAFGLILFFTAPWLARAAAYLDIAATAMLGPSRAEQLARHVSTLTESRAGVVSAADAERRRIERDLHDGTQQRLVSMAMRLGLARATLEGVPAEAMAVIERAHEEAKEALRELRDLVQGLQPAILASRGLDAALSGIAARAPLPVNLSVELPGAGLPGTVEAVAFFIVSEALTNTAKHAGATQATVTVRRDGGVLAVTITDDGRGGADPEQGSGLRGLRQRAASVDGTLRIDSPPGGPTVITAQLPITPGGREGGQP